MSYLWMEMKITYEVWNVGRLREYCNYFSDNIVMAKNEPDIAFE